DSVKGRSRNDWWHTDTRPTAAARTGRRRIRTEKRSEEQIALEETLLFATGKAYRKTATGREAHQGYGWRGRNRVDEIGQIIFQLSDISDLTFAAGSAMTTNIQSVNSITRCAQCFRHRMHAGTGGRRTMDQHDAAFAGSRSSRWTRPVGQLRSVARRENGEWRQIGKIHRVKWIGDAAHRVRRPRAAKDDGEGENRDDQT